MQARAMFAPRRGDNDRLRRRRARLAFRFRLTVRGEDTAALLVYCLSEPARLQSDELRRISALPVGLPRNG
jgi:hypothetical protein